MRLRAAVLLGSLALALGGCMEGGAGFPAFTRAAPAEMTVARGAVVIAGPEGYCVDRGASRGGDPAFVLLASCASVSRDPNAPRPLAPGLLTASVAPAESEAATVDVMRAYFATAAGRAALARDGQESSVRLRESFVENDALFLLVEDAGPRAVPGTEPLYWRGLFTLNGHLVTLSVLSFSDTPLGRDAGLATLRAFIDRVRKASPELPTAEATAPKAQSAPLPDFLARLLR